MRPHPNDGAPLILWPPEERRPEDFNAPDPGTYTFKLKETIRANAEVNEEFDLSDPEQLRTARNVYLNLAHSLGKTEDVAAHAEDMLYRSVYLLQWTSFESFLRETIETLLAEHARRRRAGNRPAGSGRAGRWRRDGERPPLR